MNSSANSGPNMSRPQIRTYSELIDFATETLKDCDTVDALFLAGSRGSGSADHYSDVDLVAVRSAAAEGDLMQFWKGKLNGFSPIVHWFAPPPPARLANAITQEWLRCDLLVITPQAVSARARDSVQVLFDKVGHAEALAPVRPVTEFDKLRVAHLVREFIRCLGLLAVVIGRAEYVVGVSGASLLRGQIINLFVEAEVGGSNAGALRLGMLSDETRALLSSLPLAQPDRASIVDTHLTYANVFLPRAYALCERIGVEWPEAFFFATCEFLERELGVSLPKF